MPLPEPKTHRFKQFLGKDNAISWCGSNCAASTPWHKVDCNRCLQLAYAAALNNMLDIATQANLISCNLTTFKNLRNFERLVALAQRNRNRFIADEEEKDD